MSEWKEYTGSDEQIAEMRNCENGFIIRSSDHMYSNEIIYSDADFSCIDAFNVTHYLICNPHPRADMIFQQAMTGQPVWIRIKLINNTAPNNFANHPNLIRLSLYNNFAIFKKTKNIEWDLADAEYSFKPFTDGNFSDT